MKLVEKPAAYFIERNDGLMTTLLMLNGAVRDYNFAARVKGMEGLAVAAVLPDADAERDVFGVPGARDRGDVRDGRGAVSGASGR